ncbi:hypothetical protein IMZ38_01195 [Thermosphaera chiliense]|uniref:Glycosyltransferase RgtA/B/C/D-like domain-containing protein n=1 Tax=Thermosphaera chiliense TaxID=3402707 RepID=A0A7M1UUD2_9CREN|nr:hypothetical protein [Thermosphaera aggregans]QOR94584.1 hypothetical protein IMZ38_01195 [Thermosphaera aggregans]
MLRLAALLEAEPGVRMLELATHHAKYPSAVVSSLTYTLVTGVDLYSFYAFIGAPLLSLALGILFYALLRRFFQPLASSLGALALAIYPSFTLFTSAYLKEVYAHPVALTLLLLMAVGGGKSRWLGIATACMGLVLSHPLTSLITLAYLTTLMYVRVVDALKNPGLEGLRAYSSTIYATALLGVACAVFAWRIGMPVPLNPETTAMLVAYGLVFYASYLVLFSIRHDGLIAMLTPSLLVFELISHQYSVFTEALKNTLWLLLYATPLAFLAATPRKSGRGEPAPLSPVPAVLPVAATVLYVSAHAGFAASIVHRFLNYLVYPVGLGLAKASKTRPFATCLLAIVLLASSTMLVYEASTGGDSLTFYWRYTVMDLELKSFVEAHSSSRLLGSAKYWYMLGEEHASIDLGLVAALADEGLGRRLLVFSTEELRYGFPVSPLHYVKPCFSMQAIRGLVYSNSYSFIGVL